jgi:iron-sulfur cluster assembly protein
MAIAVSDTAVSQIKKGLVKEGIPEGGLRLGVKGGGCSGLMYVLRFEPDSKAGDKILDRDGVRLFVDLKSRLYLKGMTLDWQGDLMQQGFTFVNPNATKTCSCGQSFFA